MSRARTAICSAPLEWPSRPGLPTRIFGVRPIVSPTRATSSRRSATWVGRRGRRGLADAGRRAVGAEGVAQGLRPFAGGHAGAGGLDGRLHHVLVGRGGGAELVERGVDPGLVALGAPLVQRGLLLLLRGRVDGHDPALGVGGEGGGLGLLVAVDADQDLLARLDAAEALAVGVDQRGLHVRHGLDGPAVLGDPGHLGLRGLLELLDEALHDRGALEDVGVLEQVGLVGEHLLDAQRPLLVPRAGEAERLVPGGELDGAGAGVAAERDGQRLEHDPLDVVLGLGLGEAEGVDLDAVAEAAVLLVLHAVALAAELVPQLAHRAQLRVLLDEADAGVDEEGDAAEHGAHAVLGDALLHLVEHGDGGRERVRDLLRRRGPRLLQVVGADVDRVPLRDALDRVGDHVRDQAKARSGRERVRAAAQVLLDDVVLGGPLEDLLADPVLLGGDDVERQQPRRGGVDRHRGVHLVERDPVQQGVHVALVRHGHPDLADLPPSELVVGVVAGLGREVEGDAQAGLALGQVPAVQLIGLPRGGMARVRAHHPGLVGPFQAVAHASQV